MPQAKWRDQLQDGNNKRTSFVDRELGKESTDPASVDCSSNAKRAWNQQYTNGMTSEAHYVEPKDSEQLDQNPGEIQVEKTFASHSEQR